MGQGHLYTRKNFYEGKTIICMPKKFVSSKNRMDIGIM